MTVKKSETERNIFPEKYRVWTIVLDNRVGLSNIDTRVLETLLHHAIFRCDTNIYVLPHSWMCTYSASELESMKVTISIKIMSRWYLTEKRFKKIILQLLLNPAYSGEIFCGYAHRAIMRYVNLSNDLSRIFAENDVWGDLVSRHT